MEQGSSSLEAPAAKSVEELLAEGKRCTASGDVAGAVENFQEACSQLAAVHGQAAEELAEPYYLYGRALLDVARSESAVLGAGLPGADRQSTSDEEENGEEENGEREEEGDEGEGDEGESGGKPEPQGEGEQEVTAAPQDAPPPLPSDTPGPSTSRGEGSSHDQPGPSTEEGAEEETDLKLAWEILELARLICLKKESEENKLKLADITLALGEVGLEADQYDQAIGDLQACLQLRAEVLEPTDRRLAEVHFHLGLAYTLAKQVEYSIQEYKIAKETLEKRRGKLQTEMSEKEEGERQKLQEEVEELDVLLPDLDSKIADAQELKRIMEEKEREEKEEEEEEASSTTVGFGEATSNEDQQQAPPITDISHLVRKRRAEDDTEDSAAAKRARKEEENGDDVSGEDKTADNGLAEERDMQAVAEQ